MELEYGFPNLPELKNLRILVNNNNGKIRASLQGNYSLRTWILVKSYFTFHNKIGFLSKFNGSNVVSMYLPPIPSLAHARMFEAFLSSVLYKRLIPMAVTIGVTNSCQCSCVHCSAQGRSKTVPVMTIEELKNVTQQCLDLGISNFTFTGGEPLLRTDLEEIISYISPKQAISIVFTNALELTTQRAHALKKAGLFGVHISLDSSEPTEHNRLRGKKGAFLSVQEGVKNALKVGLMVGISTYATREKALKHDILPIADLCAQWGVHEISVFDAIQTGKMKDQEGILLDRKARQILLDDSNKINQKYKGKPRVITQTWTNTGKGFSRFIGCLAANWQFHITAQGDFTPCDFTPLSFGNIREESVKNLWEKILHHPAYCFRKQTCRMQDTNFRSKYIKTIPKNVDLPYSIYKL